MFEIETLDIRDSRIFLAQAFEHGVQNETISFDRLEILHEQIVAISNKLITVKVRDSSSKHEIENWVTNAFILISLGLEYASKGDLVKAVNLLNQNDLVKFFQIGNTLAKRLTEYAKEVKENAILVSSDIDQIEVTLEKIEIYNAYENQFFEAVISLQLNIVNAKIILESSGKHRPITAISDLNLVRSMLENLERRSEYYHTLPKSKIFDANFADLEFVDGSEIVLTQALMINLALYRQLEFHVTQEDIDNFHDICYDEEFDTIRKDTVDLLIGWIGHFLDQAGRDERVKHYAIEYWRYCLEKLAEIV